jgi:predicted nicotinamide N-methyase
MVATVVAARESINSFESFLVYFPDSNAKNVKKCLKIKESTYMVDGIGGGVWEGAIIMSKLLEAIKVDTDHRLIELGCGAGLSGIVAALYGAKVLLTDRTVDLAEQNVAYSQLQFNPDRQLLQEDGDISSGAHSSLDIHVQELCWEANNSKSHFFGQMSTIDIIVGAEITCLRKQQQNLMKTIEMLSGPSTVVLLSFDDIPMILTETRNLNEDEKPSTPGKPRKLVELNPAKVAAVSKYEKEMNQRMRLAGFHRAVVCTAKVEWHKEDAVDKNSVLSETPDTFNDFELVHESNLREKTSNSKRVFATVDDITSKHYNDLESISFPQLQFGNGSSLKIIDTNSSSDASHHTHHITAYYRPSALSVCSRCHKKFLLVLNKGVKGSDLSSGSACRHHGGYYVCRYHPAELRLSINGGGDGMGYYGNGKEGWEAKFWDCCGNEDINAPGCMLKNHVSY